MNKSIAIMLASVSLAMFSIAQAEVTSNTVPSPRDYKLPVTAAEASGKKDGAQPRPARIPIKQTVNAEEPVSPGSAERHVFWTVRSGETLSRLSTAFAVKVGRIAAANQIQNRNLIRSDEVLTIPVTAAPVYYNIMPSDTIDGIAKSLNLPAEEIVKVNHLGNPNLIKAGARLLLPVELQKAPHSTAKRQEVAVTAEAKSAPIDEQRIILGTK